MVTDVRGRPRQFLRRVRNRPSLRRRSRLHAMIRPFAIVGGMGAVVFGVGLAYRQALELEALALERVALNQVPGTLIEPVRNSLQPYYGYNLLALELADLRRDLERIPGVRAASVRRVLPNGLVVAVEPRQPRAILLATDGRYVVDGEGVVLAGPDAAPGSLPKVRLSGATLEARPGQVLSALPGSSTPLRSALAVINWLERGGAAVDGRWRIDHLRIDRAGVVLVAPRTGVEVILGDEQNLSEKFAALRSLLTTDPPSRPAVVDLRYRDMLVVRDLSETGDGPPRAVSTPSELGRSSDRSQEPG